MSGRAREESHYPRAAAKKNDGKPRLYRRGRTSERGMIVDRVKQEKGVELAMEERRIYVKDVGDSILKSAV